MLGMPVPSCRRYHPAKADRPYQSDFDRPCCLHPGNAGSAFGARLFEATLRSLALRLNGSHPLAEALSVGFRNLISRPPATPAMRFLIVTSAGLSPAEHTSLSWTHAPQTALHQKAGIFWLTCVDANLFSRNSWHGFGNTRQRAMVLSAASFIRATLWHYLRITFSRILRCLCL